MKNWNVGHAALVLTLVITPSPSTGSDGRVGSVGVVGGVGGDPSFAVTRAPVTVDAALAIVTTLDGAVVAPRSERQAASGRMPAKAIITAEDRKVPPISHSFEVVCTGTRITNQPCE